MVKAPFSKADAAKHREAVTARLDADFTAWRSAPDTEVTAWLRLMGVKTLRGLWFDEREVKELRRAVAAVEQAQVAKVDAKAASRVEQMRLWLLTIIADHGKPVTVERRAEIDRQLDYIGLSLLEDEFGSQEALHRGWRLAERKWRPDHWAMLTADG